jgi:hypothetical protein
MITGRVSESTCFAPTLSNRARRESRRLTSRLGHGALTILAWDPTTTGRLGELRDKFLEHYDDASSASRCIASSVYNHLAFSPLFAPPLLVHIAISPVQAMRGAFESAGIDMSHDAWATAFVDHLTRCGGDVSVHTAHSLSLCQ